MKHSLPSVTIGIAAFNEENNIRNVIQDVLNQNQEGWILKKIIVACGGCTDRTVEYARSMNSPLVKILVNPKREGKGVDEQKIIDSFSSDFLVMFDADVRLDGKNVITDLIKTFGNYKKVVLVGGNPRPFKPNTFFEKAVYSTFKVLDLSRKSVKSGNNIFGCSGQCLAMRKSFAKTIAFPKEIIAEDDFIYFTCIKNGQYFRYCDKAIVYYKLPKTLGDYVRQIFRADSDSAAANVEKYFGKIVYEEYHRPLFFYFMAVLKSFIENPLGSTYMILIRMVTKPFRPFLAKRYKLSWFTARSTK